MDNLIKDLRYGIRSLLRRPGFTAIVVIILSLGIGATTSIVSIVDALLPRSMPYPDSARLVMLREVGSKGGQMAVTEPNFEDILTRSQSFNGLAVAAGSFPLVVTGGNEAVRA